jgi:integrase
MARPTNRLSARFVTTAKEPGRHADGGGLYLQVDDTGAKRWVFVFQWKKKRKEMGLGGLAVVGLGEARTAAVEARKLVHAGKNPIEERKAAGEVPTFGAMADELIEALTPEWRNPKHAAQWKLSLEVHAKPLRDKPVNVIDTEDVLGVLKPIWLTIPETASRTRGRIERVLDAARAKGKIKPPWENPARWKAHLKTLLPKRQKLTRGHHPAMPFADAPAFMADLRSREAVAAKALELTVLGAMRTNETLGARWPEIDRAAKIWTVPPERMKAGVEHRVPLTPAMLAVLDAVEPLKRADDGYIFPGQKKDRPLSNMAMDMLLRRMGQDEFTVHGFRSTFRDWAGECTNFASDVIEAALAHTVGTAVERAYRRGDALAKRRKLMEAWAGYLARPVGGAVSAFSRPS